MLAGPGTLRFILQPTIAALVGVLHGVRDARLGHRPYLAVVIASPGERAAKLREGLRAILLPLIVALAASVVFQYIVVSRVRLVYVVLYAAIFVAVPYFALRTLTDLLMSARRRGRPGAGPLQPAT
jgi:hypothetical protein